MKGDYFGLVISRCSRNNAGHHRITFRKGPV